MAMMCDVLIGSLLEDVGGALLIWDNCGPHKVPAVKEVFESWNIATRELPPRCSSELQVMDLVVNGPLKAAVRRQRTRNLFNYFQTWKIDRLKALTDQVMLPPFAPPAPKLAEGLMALFEVLKTKLAAPEFNDSLDRIFIKVDLKREPGADEYVKYTTHKKLGSLMGMLLGKEDRDVWVERQQREEVATLAEICY